MCVCVCVRVFFFTPLKFNIDPKKCWKINFLLRWLLLRVHVKLRGCRTYEIPPLIVSSHLFLWSFSSPFFLDMDSDLGNRNFEGFPVGNCTEKSPTFHLFGALPGAHSKKITCQNWVFEGYLEIHQHKKHCQVIQAVTFSSPIWRSLSLWKGHLTIPKRSQRIARCFFLHFNCWCCFRYFS